jgi:parallel beta-helix repeat protein
VGPSAKESHRSSWLRAAVLLIVVSALLLAASPAAASHISCGDVITEDATLDSDLIDCPGNGIVIDANDVTLDLNGHVVDGRGHSWGITAAATPEGRSGVTIENGSVRDFEFGVVQAADFGVVSHISAFSNFVGIDASTPSGHVRVERNTLEGNGHGIKADTEDARIERNVVQGNCVGLEVGGFRNLVRHNDVRENSCLGLELVDAREQHVVANRIVDNGSQIDAFPHPGLLLIGSVTDSVIEKNRLAGNRSGIVMMEHAQRNLVERNHVVDSALDGIAVIQDQSVNADNLIVKNIARRNGDDGIDIDVASNYLRGNLASKNGDFGIEAVPGVIDGGKNRAFGNGNPLQCLNVDCK